MKQITIFLFETIQNVAYQRTNYSEQLKDRKNVLPYIPVWYTTGAQCSLIEWVYINLESLGCDTFGIMKLNTDSERKTLLIIVLILVSTVIACFNSLSKLQYT